MISRKQKQRPPSNPTGNRRLIVSGRIGVKLQIRKKNFLGTWKGRGLLQTVKLHILKRETQWKDEEEHTENIMSTIPCNYMLVPMGDFNAKVGKTTEENHIGNALGKYGMGDSNARVGI